MSGAPHVVIVGAGHGGANAAFALRQFGHQGPITLIGAERTPPYHRPPLSKAWLTGASDLDGILLRPERYFADQSISTRFGEEVAGIDRGSRVVRLHRGEIFRYDFLILATGARARPINIPGSELHGVFSLRHLHDAEAIKAALTPGSKLCVIGGGYIGLETAASARKLGCTVTVIERENRLLPRTAEPALANYFLEKHRAHGVDFLFGAAIEAFIPEGGAVAGVKFANGERIACETVLAGIGAIPNIELADRAGLQVANGVVVDENARTSDPNIFAIGDVTLRPMPLYENRMWRLESVPNAIEQAKQAAAAICGKPVPAPEAPWFWSDQYEVKLQIAGLPFDAEQTILRGDPTTDKFSIVHLRGDALRAVEAVNAAADFVAGRMILQNRQRVDIAKISDASVPLKDCVLA